jgi:hypothetical protein
MPTEGYHEFWQTLFNRRDHETRMIVIKPAFKKRNIAVERCRLVKVQVALIYTLRSIWYWFDSFCRLLLLRVFLRVFLKTELNNIT